MNRSSAFKSRLGRPTLLATATFLLGVSLAPVSFAQDSGRAEAAEVEITDKARAHFRAGVNLVQDPGGAKYEEAYQQFKAAYAESPSWKILGNLGVTAMSLERYGEAIDAITKYLAEGGDEIPADEREQYQRDLETLQASAVTIALSGAPAGSSVTDVRIPSRGNDIKLFYRVPESGVLEIRVRPGRHTFTVESDEAGTSTWKVDVAAGSDHDHTFEFSGAPAEPEAVTEEPPSSSGGNKLKVPAYVALGVGVVGVGLGSVFLIQRSGHKKDGDDLFGSCEASQACGSSEVTEIEEFDKKAATSGTLSVVSFGVGVAGLGTGLALLLMGGGEESPVEANVGSVTLQPFASFRHVGVTGSF